MPRRSIPEWRVADLGMGRYGIEDEYGETAPGVFDSYHEALFEAARLMKEALDNYDGGED
jgi:hypothetical protein